MSHSATSDPGLHCLPVSFYGMLGINGLMLSTLRKIFKRHHIEISFFFFFFFFFDLGFMALS